MQHAQLPTLLSTIRSFDVERAQAQLANLTHLWSFEYVNAYIMRRLQSECSGVPLPKAAWSDDLGCDCGASCGGRC